MRGRHTGFTLLEMMIVISIIGIILSIGLPGLTSYFYRATSHADTERIGQLLRFARSSAISQNQEITTCFSNDLLHCDRRASNYVVVFKDQNTNRIADDDEVLEFAKLDDTAARILFNMSVGRHYIRHRPNGTVKEFGHITYCPGHGDLLFATRLIVSRMGRARAAQDSDNDGIVNAVNGDNVAC